MYLPPEARVAGIEDRHQHIGVGAVIVHRETYERTGKVFVALGKERKERRISLNPSSRKPRAPKLRGQWSLIWETVERADFYHNGAPTEDAVLSYAIARAIGQEKSHETIGEEVTIKLSHPPSRFHLNTLRFATQDQTIMLGEENTALANFIIWDEAPFMQRLRLGSHFDMGEVHWLDLDELLDPRFVFRETLIDLNIPNEIPFSPAFPLDRALRRRIKRYVRTLPRDLGKANFGSIALRPGILQTLDDLKAILNPSDNSTCPSADFMNFYINPKRFYQTRIHDTLLYCPHIGIYLKSAFQQKNTNF